MVLQDMNNHMKEDFHKKTQMRRLVVSVVIKNQNNEMCVIKETRSKGGKQIIQWSLPGGLIEEKEHLIQAAIREAKEETNVNIKIEQLLGIIDWSKSGNPNLDKHANHYGIDFIFGGRFIGGELKPQTDEKIIEVKFLDYDNIKSLNLEYTYQKAIQKYLDNLGFPLNEQIENTDSYSYLRDFI